MNKCSIKVRQQISLSAKMLASPIGARALNRVLNNLKTVMIKEEFDTVYMMHLMEAVFKAGNTTAELFSVNSLDKLEAYLKNNGITSEIGEERLKPLRALPGFGSFEEGVQTLNDLAAKAQSEETADGGESFSRQVTKKDEAANLINYTFEKAVKFTVDGTGIEMAAKKSDREIKTAGVNIDSAEYWGGFISSYFNNMTSQAVLFTEFAQDKFYNVLVDFKSSKRGVATDVNSTINELKAELEKKLLDLQSTELGNRESNYLRSLLHTQDAARERYFTEVLLTDFDFILNTLIRSISKDGKKTSRSNPLVLGFKDEQDNPENPIPLNVTQLPDLFLPTKIKGKRAFKFNPKSLIDNTLYRLDTNTNGFISDTTLSNSSFYYIEGSDKYFFRTLDGKNIDITPVSYYAYNSSSNRNTLSIDHFIDATSSGTEFINNLFPLFKLIDTDENGKEKMGRRMNGIDFLIVSQFLTTAGPDLKTFTKNLRKLAENTGTVQGKIAKSLLVQVFNDEDYSIVGETPYHSIRKAAEVDSIRGSINEDIVHALHSALINKEHLRYVVVINGTTTTTRGAENKNNAEVLNDGLATYLMEGSHTKSKIADNIRVVNNSIFIHSKSVNHDLDKIKNISSTDETEFTLTKAAEALGLSWLFDSIKNEYQNNVFNTPIESDRNLFTDFKDIIKIAAINKAKNALKIEAEDINKGFFHDSYATLTPSGIIKRIAQNNLSRVFLADPTQNITIAGKKTSSMSTPNRDSQMSEIVKSLNHFNQKVNKRQYTFNPFLLHDQERYLPLAVLQGTYLKTPYMQDGDPISLSDWDYKTRIQHAMVSGFLDGSKIPGKEFLIQPVNYSDKSLPTFHKINTDIDLLTMDIDDLVNHYIEYHYRKNKELQYVMIDSFKEFFLGSYTKIEAMVNLTEKGVGPRFEALEELKAYLEQDSYEGLNDMTKPINLLLSKINIPPSFILKSDANLDIDADYISLPGDKNTAILKPNLGVRAEFFSDRERATAYVEGLLDEHGEAMSNGGKVGINHAMLTQALKNARKKNKLISTDTRSFFDRFFLINGIYGHAIKVMTMSDETYFAGKYKDIKTNLNSEEDIDADPIPKANIPQNLVSGVEKFGTKQEANKQAKKLLGDNPHSIDMIEAGIRTRTTRSVGEMNKYGIKVGDIVKQFGKSADGTTKNILTRVTAIHPKESSEFLDTWEKEGWTSEGIESIKRFKKGAAAIEFELLENAESSVGNDVIFDINKYYFQVENGTRDGLEEMESMLVNQFKRAQSELSRGNIYTQRQTLVGLKRNAAKDNLLQHLIIRDDIDGNDIYEFDALAGKTLSELEAMGVVSRFKEPGSPLLKVLDADTIYVKFNIGKEQVVIGTSPTDILTAVQLGVDKNLVMGIVELLNNMPANDIPGTVPVRSSVALGVVETPDSRANALTLQDILNEREDTRNNSFVSMPDYTPSILLTDPVSYVNLLNSMNINQENSDAIQFIHPLLSLIMENARGNSLGAFNTEFQEAIKTVTTTYEYDKFRQSLQKKSVQMPFSEEQFAKTGTMDLYNAFKKLNIGIPFTKRNLTFTPTFYSPDGTSVLGEEITGRFENLQALYDRLFNDPRYIKGGDTIWRTILDVMRENPENMFNFVGLIGLPSNQKTGRKKMHDFDKVVSNKSNVDLPLNIDYVANEFNYEILTKAHEYDISGKFEKASSITLLSQLVNAVSFGGLSNINSIDIQNAMSGKMMLNRNYIGKGFADVVEELQKEDNPMPGATFKLMTRLSKGDVATGVISSKAIKNVFSREELIDYGKKYLNKTGSSDSYIIEEAIKDLSKALTVEELEAYTTTMRLSVTEMVKLAFNDLDSTVLKKIVIGEKISTDADGKTILDAEGNPVIEKGAYSLDSPAVRSKVLGTLRSAFFKDTVKMKMSGFIATVSAAHKVVSAFTGPGGKRFSRYGYINAMLINSTRSKKNILPNHGGEVLDLKTLSKEAIAEFIIPFDNVAIKYNNDIDPKWVYVPLYTLKLDEVLADNNIELRGVKTPDISEDPTIDAAKYEQLPSTTLIEFKGNTYYKWYLEERLSPEDLNTYVSSNAFTENVLEKYSLRWMQVVKKNKTPEGPNTIEETEAYKNYYRNALAGDDLSDLNSSDVTEAEFEASRAEIIVETHSRDINNELIWDIIDAEVVVPNFLKDSFNIPKEHSINDIIGYIPGEERIKATEYFTRQFNSEEKQKDTYSKYVNTSRRIYSRIAAVDGRRYAEKILDHLNTNYLGDDEDAMLSNESMKWIEAQVRAYEDDIVKRRVDGFLGALDIVLTRIPGQSKQSGFVGNILEFFDGQGNASFAPTAHMVNTGGDMDIDTLSILTKSITREGFIEDPKTFNVKKEGFNVKNMTNSFNYDIEQSKKRIKSAVIVSNREAKKRIKQLEQQEIDMESKGMKITDDFKLSLINNRKNIITAEEEKKIIKRAASIILNRYNNILANAVATSVFESLSNVSTAVEVNSPISMGMFKAIIDKIEDLQLNDNSMYMRASGETYTTIFKYEDLAAQGKESVGIYATVLKINSAIQAAKINYDAKYKKTLNYDSKDPFNFVHTLEYVNPFGKDVEQTSTGFADLERFGIMQSVEKSGMISEAVKNILKRTAKIDVNSMNILTALLEDSVIRALKLTDNKKLALNIAQKARLGEIFGNNGNNDDILQIAISIKNITKQPAIIVEEIIELLDVDITTVEGKEYMLRILKDTYVKPNNINTYEGANYAINVAKKLFGLDLPTTIFDSPQVLRSFRKYMTDNPELIKKAYVKVIGKQLSNDIQSQYLSAATDNAKELILGKIKSNALTNPTISTMMLLGYDVDTIIEFLYDEDVSAVFDYFLKKKSNLEKTVVKASEIENSGVSLTPSVKSLISILEVSERVAKFRSLRNLNENSQIEQSKLDRILYDIGSLSEKDSNEEMGIEDGSDILYNAIMSDDINLLEPIRDKNDEIFNQAILIFLHPQSRSLFINIYESENNKLKVLSNIVTELKEIIGEKNTSHDAYKNTNSHLSDMQILSFLNRRVDNKVQTGVISVRDSNGVFTQEYIELNNPHHRKEFVLKFGDFIDDAKIRYNSAIEFLGLKSYGENSALSSLGTMRVFGGSAPVYGYTKLANGDVSSIETALIYEGIKELKMDTGYQELNDLNKEIYTNLSLYALIVSSGEIKKGTMIEVFEDLNLDLAEFIQKELKADFYASIRIETEDVKSILFDNLKYEKDIKPAKKYTSYDNSDVKDYIEQVDEGFEINVEAALDPEQDYSFNQHNKVVTTYYSSVSRTAIFRGNHLLEGRLYRSDDKNLVGAIFHGGGVNKPSYRIFKTGPKESNPSTLLGEDKMIINSAVSYKMRDELNRIGYQVGKSVKYGKNKDDARILAFLGKEAAVGSSRILDKYLVSTDEGLQEIFGIDLMENNENLFLHGNIIEDRSRRNLFEYNKMFAIYEFLRKQGIETPAKKLGTKVNSSLKILYTAEDLEKDAILKREYNLALDKAVLLLTGKNTIKNSFSYEEYYDKKGFIPATELSSELFVPSFYSEVKKGVIVDDNKNVIDNMHHTLISLLNKMPVGTTKNIYGLTSNIDNDTLVDSFRTFIGGIDIVTALLNRPSIGAIKLNSGRYSMANGNFIISELTNDDNSDAKYYTIERYKDNTVINYIDNTLSLLSKEEIRNNVFSYIKATNNSRIYGIDKGYINSAHIKKIKVKVPGFNKSVLVIFPEKSDKLIYIKEDNNGYDTKYYRVSPRARATGVISGTDFLVSKNVYDEIVNKIDSDKSTPLNKSC